MLRRHQKLPVYVVEDHNEALKHIYRNVASRHLPSSDVTLLHFDSHPDLLIDKNLKEATVWEKQDLYEQLSIENWILPACYCGVISKVCWLKQRWCDQIEDGCHQIVIGSYDDHIRVGTPLYYFLSDGLFQDKARLDKKKEFQLMVSTVSERKIPSMQYFTSEDHYVLDIDLDYFSTQDPFREILSNLKIRFWIDEIFSVQSRFGLDPKKTLAYREYVVIADKYNEYIRQVEHIFQHIIENKNLQEFNQDGFPDDLLDKVSNLLDEVKVSGVDVDWELLYAAGCTRDETSLPHHVSTKEEITIGLQQLRELLDSLPRPPTIVTISRSTEDDYCPKHQVEEIQTSVLEMISLVFGPTEMHFEYLEPN